MKGKMPKKMPAHKMDGHMMKDSEMMSGGMGATKKPKAKARAKKR